MIILSYHCSCRSITDLSRNHNLFSLSTPSFHNGFLVFKEAGNNVIDIYVRNNRVTFTDQDYMLNTWQSICTTWDSESELVQLWLNGKPSIKKFIGGSVITDPIVIVGQVNLYFLGILENLFMY